MKLKLSNFIQKELIGLNVTICDSTDPTLIGIEGKIIDETQKMFTILTEKNKQKKIVKENSTFKFQISEEKNVIIAGKILKGRPEDRMKKFLKR